MRRESALSAAKRSLLPVFLRELRGGHERSRKRSGWRLQELERLEERRLLAVDWRNPVDSLDVDQSGFVVAFDALQLINDLNTRGARPLPPQKEVDEPFLDVNGDQFLSPIDALLIINHLNTQRSSPRVLTQGNRFANESEIAITLGANGGSREYQVQLDTSFASKAKNDMLAVYLVDAKGTHQTLLDRGTPGTAFFTLGAGRVDYVPGLVSWNGSVLSIDLSSIEGVDTGLLRFQLLTDTPNGGSQITIKPLSNRFNDQGAARPRLAAQAERVVSPAGPADLSQLQPAPDVEAIVDHVAFDSSTGKYSAQVHLFNRGAAVGKRLAVSFPGLPSSVTLLNPSGVATDGSPYVNLEAASSSGGLQGGDTTAAVSIELSNPSQVPFALKPNVWAGANHAPTLEAIGPLSVMPGATLQVPLRASDTDGDDIRFTLRSSLTPPQGSLKADGTLVFQPTPSDVGTYQFEVIATDGTLAAQQAVVLHVLADPIATTRISGKVLQTNGQPLANMQVEIGANQGLTASDGSFALDLGAGPIVSDTLKVRGDLFGGSGAYPFIAEKLALILGQAPIPLVNNVIPRPIYLPVLDLANGRQIDPARDTLVTTPAIDDVSLLVGAGTLMNQQGTPFTGVLSITEVPVSLTPAALPENLFADLVVTIQPGEMVFSVPAPMTFPNRSGWAPGTLMDLWSINPVTGQFDDVGDMRVSPDGTKIETISGGVRNSSWHFAAPPVPEPDDPDQDNANPDDGCDECPPATAGGNSIVELHSGAEIESHTLVSTNTQGVDHAWTLTYDSRRADPRPIVHFGFNNTQPFSNLNLVASMKFERGGFTYEVPGYDGGQYGLPAGSHIWSVPPDQPDTKVALQADLRSAPSGLYNAQISSGLMQFNGQAFVGSLTSSELQVLHVNAIDSQFGAGWGLNDLQELVENPDGSVIVIDGNGDEGLYLPPLSAGQPYRSSPGNFSTLTRMPDRTFRITSTDQTVTVFNAQNKLASVTDRNGNAWSYGYDAQGRLVLITDPVGQRTEFAIGNNGKVSQITDSANRVTRLEYDAQGNLTRIIDPDNTIRTWQYDAQHRMTGEIDKRGIEEHTIYDFAGRVQTAILKDGTVRHFQPLQVRNLLPADATIDPLSPAIAGGIPATTAGFADENGNVTSHVLDRAGQTISSSDGEGRITSVKRDAQNQIVSVTDGRGHVELYEYDAHGNLASIRDENSGGSQVLGSIASLGERDIFEFHGGIGDRIIYDALSSNGDDLRVQLLSPSGKSVFFGNDDANAGPFTLSEEGTYRLELFGNNNATGDYAFSLFAATKTSAPLPLGQEVFGDLQVPGDLDTFTFDGRIGQRLYYDGLASNSDDLRAQLVSPTGQILFFDHDEANSGALTLGEAGLYKLNLFGNADATGDYHFRMVEPTAAVLPLSLGADVAGTIGVPGELDSYAFDGAVGQRLFYDGLASASDDLRVQLVSPSGRVIFFDHDEANLGAFTLNEGGAYRLNLYGNAEATGDYHFRLIDAPATALPLTLGSEITGSIDVAGELDSYFFDGAPGQQLYYDALASAADDLRVQLVSPSGRVIFFDHDEANLGTFSLNEAGVYWLHLFGNSDASGDYHFRLLEPTASDIPLTLGADVTGAIDQPGDLDSYAFDAVVGQRLYYDALPSASDDLRAQLVSPSGQVIFFDHDAANLGTFTLRETGSYRLHLFGNSDATGDYHFRLSSPTVSVSSLPLNAAVNGTVASPGEADVWTIDGVVGQRVAYNALPSAADDLRVQMVDPSGNILFFDHDEANRGPFILSEAGTYRVQLFGSGDTTGDYQFQLLDLARQPLVLATPIAGTLTPGISRTAYAYSGTRGQRLTFASSQSGNATWTLFGPAGQVLGGNVGLGTSFTVTLPSDGPVTLLLAGTDSANPVSYQFQVLDVTDASVAASGFGVTHTGALVAGQSQAFPYQASAGMIVWLDSTVTTNAAPLRLELKDPLGQTVLFSDDQGERGPVVLDRSGTYTLSVSGDTPGSSGNYAFTLIDLLAAPAIGLGTAQTGPLAAFETRAFTLSGSTGQSWFYDGLDTDFDNVRAKLVSPSGAQVSDINADASSGPVTLTETGTYQLLINNLSQSATDFNFQVVSASHDVQTLTLGATISDSLLHPGDQKEYRFAATVGERFFYDSLQNDFALATRARLLSPSGATVFNNNTDANFGPFTAMEAGVYRLLISGDNDATGPFSFRMLEPNFASNVLTLGSVVDTSLAGPGDTAEYTFVGSVGQRIFYDSLQNDFAIATRVQLLSPSAAVLINNNSDADSGPLTLTESGQYRLLISGDNDAFGSYGFRLLQPAFTSESVSIGQTVSGALANPGDEREFTFAGTVGQRIFYDSLQSDFGGGQRAVLFSPTGAVLFNDNQDANQGPISLTQTGTYRLVMSCDNDATGSFSFRLTSPTYTSQPYVPGTIISAALAGPGDEREVTFAASVGEQIFYDGLQSDFGGGQRVQLFSPSGATLFNDNQDANLGPLPVKESGNYRLVFSGDNDVTGTYSFRLLKPLHTSQALALGSQVTGALDAPGDRHEFTFLGAAGQRIFFDSLQNDFHSGQRVQLIAPSGAVLFNNNQDYDQGPVTLVESGMYLLLFSGDGDVTGDFGFRVLDVSSAPRLDLDTTVSGSLPVGQSSEFLRLHGTAGQRLYFDSLQSAGMRWALYGPDGSVVVSSSDFSDFKVELPADGNYFLELRSTVADSSASYKFRAITPATVTEPLEFGAIISGDLNEPGDQHIYTFTGALGQRVLYDSQQNDFAAISVRLVSPSGVNVMNQNSDDENVPVATLLENGTYQIVVDASGDITGSYRFRLLNASTAPEVGLLAPIAGTLDPGLETVAYRLEGKAGQRLQISFSTTVGYNWSLLSPSNSCIVCNATPGSSQSVSLQSAGSYIVVVRGADVATSHSYGIGVTDVSDAAVAVSGLPIVQSGTLAPQQVATFQFSAPAGLSVLYDALETDNDSSVVELRDPTGGLVFSLSANMDAVPVSLPRSGTYTLKVTNASAAFPADYDFQLLNLAAARKVLVNAVVNNVSLEPDETDVYAIHAVAGQRLYLDTRATGLGAVRQRLLGPDGELVFDEVTDIGVGPITIARTGDYTLLVGGAGASSGDYSFRLLDLLAQPSIAADTLITDSTLLGVEADALRFVGQANQMVSIITTSPVFNSRARLFDSANRLLATVVVGQSQTIQLPRTEEYVLVIDANATFTQSYTLRVSPNSVSTTLLQPQTLPSTLPGRRTFTYDATFSQQASETNELGQRTIYQTDPANGNLLSTTRIVSSLGGNADLVTAYTYTPHGLVDKMVDPLGRVTDYDYDALDRLIAITSAVGTSAEAVVRYEYDAPGNRTALIDENGHRTQIEYDSMNRVVRVTEPDPDGAGPLNSPVTQTFYDPNGHRIEEIEPGAEHWKYEFDARDRLIKEIDPLGGETSYQFDAAGNLSSRKDASGQATTFDYDNRNRLTASVDPTGAVTRFDYDADDQLIATMDPRGHTVTNQYDARGRLVRTIDPLGNVSQSVWDAADRQIAAIDQLGRREEYAYDALDRLTEVTDALGGVTRFEYDAAGNLTAVVDPLQRRTEHAYDARDRRTSTTDPLGGVTAWQYDAKGNAVAQRDAMNRTKSFVYDALDRLITQTDALGGTARSAYDERGNLISSIDALGHETRYAYDALDRKTSSTDAVGSSVSWVYDAVGNVVSYRDELNHETSFVYDGMHRLKKRTNAMAGVDTYTYDPAGNLITAVDPLGRPTSWTYDALNRQVTTTSPLGNTQHSEYDAAGNVVATIDALGHETHYAYDLLNREIRITDAAGGVSATVYDAVGNVIAQTDEEGRASQYIYDALDRLIIAENALHNSTRYAYDAIGKLTTTTDPLNHVTTYGYDQLDRRVSITSPNNEVTTFKYDAVGNLLQLTDPVQNTTHYEYDAADRVLRKTNQNGDSRSVTYNAAHQPISTTDRDGRTINFTYDALLRKTGEVWLDSAAQPVNTLFYRYDGAGQIVEAGDDQSHYEFGYDLDGHRTRTSNAGTAGTPDVVLAYAFDAASRLTSRRETIQGTVGATTAYAYDALDRLSELTQSGQASKQVRFVYNRAGQLVSLDQAAGPSGSIAVSQSTYAYDSGGRLVSLIQKHAADLLAEYQWSYDAADRLTQTVSVDGISTFAYDARGQLLSADNSVLADESFSYDANGNRNAGGYVTAADNRLQTDGTDSFAYDAEGNLTRRVDGVTGQITEFRYDHRNRLIGLTVRDANLAILSSANYVYDVFDNRIGKSIDRDGAGPQAPVVERYVYDGDHIALQFDGSGSLTHRYLHGLQVDQVFADQRADGSVLWNLTDNLGSVRDQLDSTGAQINHIVYGSFGDVQSETNAAVDHLFGFVGREHDDESGLLFYRSRYYDPAIGRFISQDPSEFMGGDENLYRYVENAPRQYTDPFGLQKKFCLIKQKPKRDPEGDKKKNDKPPILLKGRVTDVSKIPVYGPTTPVDHSYDGPAKGKPGGGGEGDGNGLPGNGKPGIGGGGGGVPNKKNDKPGQGQGGTARKDAKLIGLYSPINIGAHESLMLTDPATGRFYFFAGAPLNGKTIAFSKSGTDATPFLNSAKFKQEIPLKEPLSFDEAVERLEKLKSEVNARQRPYAVIPGFLGGEFIGLPNSGQTFATTSDSITADAKRRLGADAWPVIIPSAQDGADNDLLPAYFLPGTDRH